MTEVENRLRLFSEGDVDAAEVRKLEKRALADLNAISARSRIARPRAVGLTKDLSRQWASYEAQRQRLEADVYMPSLERVRVAFNAAVERLGLASQARQMAYETLSELTSESERYVRRLSSEVRTDADGFHERAVRVTKDSIKTVRSTIEEKLIDFERRAVANLDPDTISHIQAAIESDIREETERQAELLRRLADHIASVSVDGPSNDELLTAMETDLEDRRDREEQSLRLAQMGQAVGIVHHEFSAAIRSVRQNVRQLATWADRNEKFRAVYNELTESYSHLDSYLSLFTPLNRSLSQTKRVIKGADIAGYLIELLGERFRRHAIRLIVTDKFNNFEVETYVSTIYPAFVNLIDNAIYWLEHGQHLHVGETQRGEKKIILDAQGSALIVSDSGPGVLPQDELSIFETGYSRKPGGSGLGLSITRDVLAREGYSLSLTPYKRGHGATFRIEVPYDETSEEQS